jgi:hypothetical protein
MSDADYCDKIKDVIKYYNILCKKILYLDDGYERDDLGITIEDLRESIESEIKNLVGCDTGIKELVKFEED